jgi:hypothetical protein
VRDEQVVLGGTLFGHMESPRLDRLAMNAGAKRAERILIVVGGANPSPYGA